ncbi:DUF2339 domain-containing protein [Zhengella mangrovi]|uniref:DUF2339 domain-containing protein n=1 Tax=Zhengella mangrovi TaxID=1982044 RepID=UPI0013FDE4DA|nr:DUF2339 domain-containing protein [Zhengella mangrovi]
MYLYLDFSNLIAGLAVIGFLAWLLRRHLNALKQRLADQEARLETAENILSVANLRLKALEGQTGAAQKPPADGAATAAAEAAPSSTEATVTPPADKASEASPPLLAPAAANSPDDTVAADAGDRPAGPDLPPPLPPRAPVDEPVPAAARAGPQAELPARSLEETIGSRWAIWVGGLAFALGGLFLVRYSIEAGLFGPRIRMAVAALAGLLAMAGGEIVRRRQDRLGPEADRLAQTPAILTAAGVLILFGVAYAAHAVYGWVPSSVGFVTMGLVSLVAIALAIPHGTALAGLGLVGSFATPLLVVATEPRPYPLFGFFAVVLVAAAALSRLKEAGWVLVLGLAGTAFWLVLDARFSAAPVPWASLIALAAMVGAVAAVWLAARDEPESLAVAIAGRVGVPVFAAALLTLLAALYALGSMGLTDASVRHAAGITALLLLFMALWRPGGIHGAPAGALLVSGVLAGWMLDQVDAVGVVTNALGEGGDRLLASGPAPDETAYLVYAFALAVPFLAACVLMAWRLAQARMTAMLWAFSGVLPSLVALVLAVASYARWDEDYAYGPAALAIAALIAAGAWVVWGREEADRPLYSASAVLFVAASLPLGLAVHLLATAAWTGILLAAIALALVLASARDGHPVFGWIAALGAAVVLVRFAVDPTVADPQALSTTPVLNWLTPGYFLPAIAFALSARSLRRMGATTPRNLMEAFALTAAMAGAAMLIRHGMNDGVVTFGGPVTLGEQSLYTLLAFGASFAVVRLDANAPSPVLRYGSMLLGGAGVVLAALRHLVWLNPVWTGETVGTWPLVNLLMPAYLLPGLMAAIVAWQAIGRRPLPYVQLIAGVAGLLLFAWLNLEIRHVWQGPSLAWENPTRIGELYTYPVAWLLLSLAFGLAPREVRPSRGLEWASLALGAAAAAFAFTINLFVANPYFGNDWVGTWPLVNWLAYGFLLPGILAASVARQSADRRPAPFVQSMGAISALLLFAWLNLEIRHLWQGPYLGDWKATSDGETYTYSAAWLVVGLGLLVAGLRLDRQVLRAASGVLVVLTVLKVFLFDMAELEGVLRAASFMGLGASLIGIGLFYQRVLGRMKAVTPPAEGQGG